MIEPEQGSSDFGGSQSSGLIFVSDASAEAERLTVALRSRGYPTIDVPLGLLTARVSVQRPALVLCDADAPGVLGVVEAVCSSTGPNLSVVFLGDPDGALLNERERLQAHAQAIFSRPVEVYALLRKVEALIGAPPEGTSTGLSIMPSRAPVLVAAARKPYMVDVSHHTPDPLQGSGSAEVKGSSLAAAESWRLDGGAEASAQLSLLPEEPVHRSRDIPHSRMSAELMQLLEEAETQLHQRPLKDLQRQRLTPEAELDAVLPPDVLASLDEPLDDDDDFGHDVWHGTKSGSEGGGTAPGSDGGPGDPEGADDPQSRATNPGRGLPSSADATGEAEQTDLPPTDPPPTGGGIAPLTPSPRSLSVPGAITSVAVAPEAEPAKRAAFDSRYPTGVTRETAPASMMPRQPEPEPEPEPEPMPVSTPATTPPLRATPSIPAAGGPAPERARASNSETGLPRSLAREVALSYLASVIRERRTGAVVFESADGIRRVVFREGDFVTASTSIEDESLVQFLAQRGDLGTEAAAQLGKRLPPFGRHAGAALIANGHLKQDELWSVLRAHAEWLIGRFIQLEAGQLDWETDVPDRLRSEPAVFGGSTGAEVFVDTVRRVVPRERALIRLGGPGATLGQGKYFELLGECALGASELELVRRAPALSIEQAQQPGMASDFPTVCMALVELGVLSQHDSSEPAAAVLPEHDTLDDQALRARVASRYALVEEGDYFALLGVARTATDYEIKKAHEGLKHDLLPARILTPRNADLRDQLETILEVLDEAFEVLGDRVRRERYRRALEAMPS